MVNDAPVKFDFVNVMLGSVSCRSDELLICCFSSAAAVNALTAIGTSCRLCDVRCAVTTMSSMPVLTGAAAAAAWANAGAAATIPRSETLEISAPLMIADRAEPVMTATL